MNKKLAVLAFGLFAIITFLIVNDYSLEKSALKPKDRKVLTTTYAIYALTSEIAKGGIKVDKIIPFGVDTHAYEPLPKTVADIYNSSLVIYSGVGMEKWLTYIFEREDVNNLDLSKRVELLLQEHQCDKDDGHSHKNFADPHYWLDIDNVIKMVDSIGSKLVDIDPGNSGLYKANAHSLVKELLALKDEYEVLKSCKNSHVIVTHDAFGYLEKKYKFEALPILGLSSDTMPTAKQMAALIDDVKKHNIQTVFFESLVSDKLANVISNESGASVDILYPLGNVEPSMKYEKYTDMMRLNLNALSKALDCK